MKKLLLVISFIAVSANAESIGKSSTSVKSETSTHESVIHITPVLGLAEMAVRATGTNTDYDLGVTAGALGEIGGTVAFQTGLLYNQFGGKSASRTSLKFKLDYLSVPLFVKYNALGSAEKSLYVRGGLMPGFLISKKAEDTEMGISTTDLSVSSFDLPIVIGFGGAIPVAPRVAVTVGADWVHSLTNIATRGTGEAHNDGYLLTTGATIGL